MFVNPNEWSTILLLYIMYTNGRLQSSSQRAQSSTSAVSAVVAFDADVAPPSRCRTIRGVKLTASCPVAHPAHNSTESCSPEISKTRTVCVRLLAVA
jgi:hypothetical protein